jgi:plasmid stabilization system protein ParE
MTVRVTDVATAHALAAEDRLDREHPGYGRAFIDLFRAVLTAIESMPRQFPKVDDGPDGAEFREAFIARFEYRVIFAFRDASTGEVVAVVHARRKPGTWTRYLPSSN